MKGIYVLVVRVKTNIKVSVGSLGLLSFKKGNYLYVGSAQNNIEKRVERHLKQEKKLYWHIDYLLDNNNSEVVSVFTLPTMLKSDECRVAQELLKRSEPVSGFGCSDCNCNSHLFYLITK